MAWHEHVLHERACRWARINVRAHASWMCMHACMHKKRFLIEGKGGVSRRFGEFPFTRHWENVSLQNVSSCYFGNVVDSCTDRTGLPTVLFSKCHDMHIKMIGTKYWFQKNHFGLILIRFWTDFGPILADFWLILALYSPILTNFRQFWPIIVIYWSYFKLQKVKINVGSFKINKQLTWLQSHLLELSLSTY